MILWRRHKAGCAAAAQCRCRKEQKRECHCCRCPIWPDGYFGTSRIRKSLDTADWSKAQRIAAEMEASWEKSGLSALAEREPVSIKTACDDFLENAEARERLSPPTSEVAGASFSISARTNEPISTSTNCARCRSWRQIFLVRTTKPSPPR